MRHQYHEDHLESSFEKTLNLIVWYINAIFEKAFNGFQSLTIFEKSSILDV